MMAAGLWIAPSLYEQVLRKIGEQSFIQELMCRHRGSLMLHLPVRNKKELPWRETCPDGCVCPVKAFFGTYTRACEAADNLLFSVGKMKTVDATCRAAPYGKLTPEALYIHSSGLPNLPAIPENFLPFLPRF
jgi:hypothetical protein